MDTKSTPRPWPKPEYDNHGNGSFSEWWEINGIARVYDENDAALIVRTVNAHDDMLAALKMANEYFGGAHIIPADVVQAVRDAIAKTEG